MKKFVIGFVIVAVLAVALGTAGYVSAQAPVPGSGNGTGMMGGRGGRMGNQAAGAQTGPLHDEMVTVFAQKLGISVDELNARLAKGETMAQIASSKGLTADQFSTLMTGARAQAIDQAVKNGELTQAQADWMKTRGAGMAGSGRGMRGNGQGRNANPDCPYNQTNP
jgi:hypothetical protein